MEICQKCGGGIGAKNGCECKIRTYWTGVRDRTTTDYKQWVDEEWDDIYPDVIQDIAIGASRIPDEKLHGELFRRLCQNLADSREGLADDFDFGDYNRILIMMLRRIGNAPDEHTHAVLTELPVVREKIRNQAGSAYLEGRSGLGLRELNHQRQELNVDQDWNPL